MARPTSEIIDEQIREVISRNPREQLEAAGSPRARRRMQQDIHSRRHQQMKDRYRYARAQAYNRPTTWQPYFDDKSGTYKVNRAPWFDTDGDWSADFYNPDVLERQLATKNDLYGGDARGLATLLNATEDTPMGTSRLRGIMEMLNSLQTNPELFNPMYSDLYQDDFTETYNPDMYYSKEDQIMAEDDPLHRIAMEKYGRENPFLKDWSGISEDIDVTDISDLNPIDILKAQNAGYTTEPVGGSYEYIYNDDPEPWNYDYVPREFDESWKWDYGPEFDDSWREVSDENKYDDFISRGLSPGIPKTEMTLPYDNFYHTNRFLNWLQSVKKD